MNSEHRAFNLIMIGAVCAAVIVLAIWQASPFRRDIQNTKRLSRIHEGMTTAEAIRILGPQPNSCLNGEERIGVPPHQSVFYRAFTVSYTDLP